jgi:acetyl/propionyl-CoA carboxylase alpha subunit
VATDDRDSLHARAADRTAGVESYLDSAGLVKAALAGRADAVHPGWGFLAERAEFAEAVLDAGLIWVGPPPQAMRLAADKLEARRLAVAAGLPVVPSGPPKELELPLIVKAAAGGGGRGMRVVRLPAELDTALDSARREARAGFGDDRVYCEMLVERARHIEVQVLADRHGAVVHLGERECSVQRRHQKVLEETPSPGLDTSLRSVLAAEAVALARAAGYEGAGTVEFLVRGDDHWFIELNARLQVEHPVTELVTGLDLVEEQLRLAGGEPLRAAAEPRGDAVEVRLYAEHPLTFLPQTGRIELLELPADIRVDAGVEAGDLVSSAYDPLLAKLVARGENREEAFDDLSRALRQTRIRGLTTNLPFLRWLVDHPEVRGGRTSTAFLLEHPPFSHRRLPTGPWTGFWRANRGGAAAPPEPVAPPAVEAGRHGSLPGIEQSSVAAPMPGSVIRVLVAAGERVAPRQLLVVLEAMKMETPLLSPYEAVVRRVLVEEGDQVAAGAVLVELEE